MFRFCRVLVSLIGLAAISVAPAESEADTPASCSIFDAVYLPNPAKNSDQSLSLTITEPDKGEGGSGRGIFFNIEASVQEERISTLRLGYICSMGAGPCRMTTTAGQFAMTKDMKNLADGLSFDVVALSKDFTSVPIGRAEAPHAIVIPNTGSTLTHAKNRKVFQELSQNFTKFYTPDQVFPDFSGVDVWIFDHCK